MWFFFMGSVVCLAGCATPNHEKLNAFSTIHLPDTAIEETDTYRVELARISSACLKEMFRTNKISKQFTVCWLVVTAVGEAPAWFERNRIALVDEEGTRHYPVGPGRVAYLSQSKSTAMLIAAVVLPALVPFGAPIATAGSYNVYAAVNLTGVAASGHVAGTEASNQQRAQGTRLGSLPDRAEILSGETLAGFIFFEIPGEEGAKAWMSGELRIQDTPFVFSIDEIPEVNPQFEEEKRNDAKN